MQIGGHDISDGLLVALVGLASAFGTLILRRILTRPDERSDALAAQMTTFMTSQNAFNAQLQAEVAAERDRRAELQVEVAACKESHAACERRCLGLEARLQRVEREALADPPEDQAD